ncbi:MAG: cadherin-like beta sandwich domain-containing protein, partial [Spirochaetes bacterium]|nr:cadherin-like beta sandwich domain-containing protein [Spirochaetota bacterium]
MRNTKIAAVMALLVIATLVLAGCKPPTDPVLDTNANLEALVLTGVTLSPAFAADVTSYTATVPYATASVAVSATAEADTSTVEING